MDTIWILLAMAAGGCIALQAAANGALRTHLADPRYAAFFSICGTIATAAALMIALRPSPPALSAVRSAPWWHWIGGPLGTLFVFAGAALAPRLGAAAFIAAVVAGQLAGSLLLDHFGMMNLPQQTLTAGRMAGAALVLAGVLLVRYS